METWKTCDNCKIGKLKILERSGGIVVKRGFNGKSSAQGYQSMTMFLDTHCPECGSFHGETDSAKRSRKKIESLMAIGFNKIETVYGRREL